MRLFGRSPVTEKFIAEAIDPRPSRRALLHAACACGALGLLRPVTALAQSRPARPPDQRARSTACSTRPQKMSKPG